MMRTLVAPLAGLALMGLSACGGSKSEAPPPAKKEESKKAEKGAKPGPVEVRFAPGRWESTIKVEKLDLGQMPPQVRQVIEQELGKERKLISCLTAEEAGKPDADFFGGDKSGDCTYDTYDVTGGRLNVEMSCKTGKGVQKVRLNGTYSADTYSMTMSTSGDAGLGQPMLMTMNIASRRTGACTGDEKN